MRTFHFLKSAAGILALGILLAIPAKAQQNTDLPAALRKYIPKGYTVLNVTSGDLNLDAYPDLAVILKKTGEEKTSDVNGHPEKRPLLLFTGMPGKQYRLAARSDNAVYCVSCGGIMGDPFNDLVIKKGYFTVEHYGGSAQRWTRFITFKYSAADKNWYLHKDGHEHFSALDPEKGETKVYTVKHFGKVPFDQFDIYKEN